MMEDGQVDTAGWAILVVDDSRAVRWTVREALEQMGARVTEAADGVEALEALEALDRCGGRLPDVVLLDIDMPRMDGLTCLRRLRSQPRLRSTRIVMCSTSTGLETIRQALQEGADEYLMKPFTLELLRQKLGQVGFAPAAEVLGA